jgi:UDP-N-acetylmuramoylalanine--D-glutamate ligase
MVDYIRQRFANDSIVLLGFGREGQSSYSLLRKAFPDKELAIADANESIRDNPLIKNDSHITLITGEDYKEQISEFDIIFRSPGIPVWQLVSPDNNITVSPIHHFAISRGQITSQSELFLQRYSNQVIGVTGTKGKSTTSSLIWHILKTAGTDALLAGNIGNPVFNFVDIIRPETKIVFELSSHQLEYISTAPHISVLLNLYQEHLDAYAGYEEYQLAKVNIAKYQQKSDFLIYNLDDERVDGHLTSYITNRKCYPFSVVGEPQPGGFVRDGWICFSDGTRIIPVWKVHQDRFLRGEHNLKNILAAVNVAMICGIGADTIEDGIATFKGLEHRLEYVGEFGNIHFYNDSIATIPEACMEAVKAIPDVDTLVAGGFDRGINYHGLASFLCKSRIRNIILTGVAGKRIGENLEGMDIHEKKLFYISRFDDFRDIAFRETRPGCACLLSPAAASYDEFKNFEERGKRFRALVRE